jgi:ATP-dependent Lhr-like helicase
MGDILDRIARHVEDHRTTLVFVNNRRLAERVAHELSGRLGHDAVAAHHGSLSRDRRLHTEQRLREGELRALVATASLELGIDIGPVELVCQIGSPRSIATFLQRVGRSNHSAGGTPKGILFPLSRDELVECAGLLSAVWAGELDATFSPSAPLDILAQQLVAEVAAGEEYVEDALFSMMTRAAPYVGLARDVFDEVLELVAEGITTGRGRRMAYVHRDRVNGVLRPRRGARLAALTSGGAIAEVGDYRVILEPDDTPVGSVHEDFAVEAMVGDVFLLGTHSWRILQVSQGVVRVADAQGAHPTIPFWLGEAPSRTAELSAHVSELRRTLAAVLGGEQATEPRVAARELVVERCGIGRGVAQQVVDYLATGLSQLGVLPTQQELVFERFFDETGGMQLVIHAPFGGRINKAFGLALRKRFCASFNFELQAAASDDAVVLSLGLTHSFPLESAARFLRAETARSVLSQAVLASPMFASRWRWNLNRSLAVLRFRGGRRTPIAFQRMESDDLLAAVFPALAACQENLAAGPVPIPDHLLVRQTLADCLHEAMDVDGLVELLERIDSGEIQVRTVESAEPSVLAHEILNGRPFTFLDDAPLEERRTRAVAMRRGLPVVPGKLGVLDQFILDAVRQEVAPAPRNAEELHDLLCSLVLLRPEPSWSTWFEDLSKHGRASLVVTAGDTGRWCATERRAWVAALVPEARIAPDHPLPAAITQRPSPDPDEAVAEVLRGHLDVTGPITVEELVSRTGLPGGRIRVGLGRLESEGFVLRGQFDPIAPLLEQIAGSVEGEQWCARRLLARIHQASTARLRREIEPVTPAQLMEFLLHWQHVAPGTKRQGKAGVLAVIDQLQGFELPAGAWEDAILPARVENYDHQWLEDLCLSGQVVWGRFAPRPAETGGETGRGAASPSRATPLTFALREDLPWLLQAARGDSLPFEPVGGPGRDVLDVLQRRGALFQAELRGESGRLPAEVEEGLWDLVARGLVTADGFQAVRTLLSARETWRRRHRAEQRNRLGGRRAVRLPEGREGRWALLPAVEKPEAIDQLAETVAGQLLARWGVVFWELTRREQLEIPWREVLWALRRFEARGLVRGGRFVSGCAGEQYALPEAVEQLRQLRRIGRTGQSIRLNGADPLNLVGTLLPGRRIPAIRTNWLVIRDGVPVTADHPHAPLEGVVS